MKQNRSDEGVPVTVVTVQRKLLDQIIPVVGSMCCKDEAMISAEVEGRVETTLVDLGDRVAASQELAQIDTALYEAQAGLAAANLAKALANVTNAQHNLKRTQELNEQSIASTSDLDLAVAQANQWRAEVKAAEASQAIAQLNLARSRVKAPFAGAVAERLANAGDYVKIGAPLFHLVNDAELKFLARAQEKYAAQVRKGQTIRLTVDAFPSETFTGQIYLVSPQVNTVTRAFDLGALVPNQNRRLKASMYARGELVLAQNTPALIVPLEAVLNFAGVTKVFVIEDGKARSRVVKAGPVRGNDQQIMEGLKEGETVALSGVTKLYDGARVRLPASPAGPAVPPQTTNPVRRNPSR